LGLKKLASINAGNVNTAKNEQFCRYLNGPNAQRRWVSNEEPEQGSGLVFSGEFIDWSADMPVEIRTPLRGFVSLSAENVSLRGAT
jgi:hypothetical protein